MTPETPVLSLVDALMFAGYTKREIRQSGLARRDLIALAVAEAADLGALVRVTVRECGTRAFEAAKAVVRGLGAVLRLPKGRKRGRYGLVSGRSKPRSRVTPRPVCEANRIGGGWAI